MQTDEAKLLLMNTISVMGSTDISYDMPGKHRIAEEAPEGLRASRYLNFCPSDEFLHLSFWPPPFEF
jgi:hypothetical protein